MMQGFKEEGVFQFPRAEHKSPSASQELSLALRFEGKAKLSPCLIPKPHLAP